MAQRKTLTEQQVGLLRWVAAGCPADEVEGDFYRISVAALRRRGLVTTSGRGAEWSASITASGREYLAKADGSDPPIPRAGNIPVTQQLVDEVTAAGGSLRVKRRWAGDPAYIDYWNRASLAERYGKVPDGKRLEVVEVEDELEIRLIDAPGKVGRVELGEVSVPEKVARYHPAAKSLREDRDSHEVSREQLQRAARIAHAIAKEAEQRGWSVGYASSPEGDWGDRAVPSRGGRLRITVDEHEFGIRLHEQGVHTRGPWEEEIDRERESALRWGFGQRKNAPSGPYDAEGTGALELELEDENWWMLRGRQRRWGDRSSWQLEERLPHLFREIEERVSEAKRVAEERRIEAERKAEAARIEAEKRAKTWSELMDKARRALAEQGRIVNLRAQASNWQEADLIRRYCDAMEEAHGKDPRTVEWIEWAREFAARLDPLREPPTMPNPPAETPEALQEFLPEGWSVRGPEYGRHDYPHLGRRH